MRIHFPKQLLFYLLYAFTAEKVVVLGVSLHGFAFSLGLGLVLDVIAEGVLVVLLLLDV